MTRRSRMPTPSGPGRPAESSLKGAVLTTDHRPAWLLVDEALGCYVAMTTSDHVGPLRLVSPHGTLETTTFGLGRIAYYPGHDARVNILASHAHGQIFFSQPPGAATVTLNGREVSLRLRAVRHNRTSVLSLPSRPV
jgi:hypothetical protein